MLLNIIFNVKIADMNTTSERKGRGKPAKYRGSRMFRIREALNLTQEESARELRCSLSTVARIERLDEVPDSAAIRDNFNRLAHRAGVEIEATQTANGADLQVKK